jgi:AcrR family transcriptional regulator
MRLSADEREERRLARKEKRQAARRREIVEAAAEVFRQVGLANFSAAPVVEALKVSEATIYYYFESLDALLFELAMDLLKAEVACYLRVIAGAGGGAEAMVDTIRVFYRRSMDDLHSMELLYHWLPSHLTTPQRKERVVVLLDAILDALERRLEDERSYGRASPGLQPRRRAAAFLIQLNGLVVLLQRFAMHKWGLAHELEDVIEDLARQIYRELRGAALPDST